MNDQMDYTTQAQKVVLDLSHARFWDVTSVEAIEKIINKFRTHGRDVTVHGLSQAQHGILGDQSDEEVLSLHKNEA